MANKDRNKRSVRKARAAERERVAEAQVAASGASASASSDNKKIAKAQSKAPEKKAKASDSNGIIARARRYFSDVRTELHRVTWPSRTELRNWSVAVIIALIVFGVCVWAVDTGFVALLVQFTGLRG
jgi:preprotein translocase subunit SecE